jgi:hypothetical protein
VAVTDRHNSAQEFRPINLTTNHMPILAADGFQHLLHKLVHILYRSLVTGSSGTAIDNCAMRIHLNQQLRHNYRYELLSVVWK